MASHDGAGSRGSNQFEEFTPGLSIELIDYHLQGLWLELRLCSAAGEFELRRWSSKQLCWFEMGFQSGAATSAAWLVLITAMSR